MRTRLLFSFASGGAAAIVLGMCLQVARVEASRIRMMDCAQTDAQVAALIEAIEGAGR